VIVFRYQLHLEDGADAGEVTCALPVELGDEIVEGEGVRMRVLTAAPAEDEDSLTRAYWRSCRFLS
jgi:hypothetical protein